MERQTKFTLEEEGNKRKKKANNRTLLGKLGKEIKKSNLKMRYKCSRMKGNSEQTKHRMKDRN